MKVKSILFTLAGLAMLDAAHASDVIIYPANGQDSAQQNSDEGECFVWAKDETGIDPMSQQAQSTNAVNKATFDKAYGICLQGRGYTVG